jgi:hypothetical protein
LLFEVKLIGGTGFSLLLGVMLFVRGARTKEREVGRLWAQTNGSAKVPPKGKRLR